MHPHSYHINSGLRIARQLLLEVNEMGLGAGVEFLDTISPQFIGTQALSPMFSLPAI
jgi:3-deoxy-7-phosphoheptulonate synthase